MEELIGGQYKGPERTLGFVCLALHLKNGTRLKNPPLDDWRIDENRLVAVRPSDNCCVVEGGFWDRTKAWWNNKRELPYAFNPKSPDKRTPV